MAHEMARTLNAQGPLPSWRFALAAFTLQWLIGGCASITIYEPEYLPRGRLPPIDLEAENDCYLDGADARPPSCPKARIGLVQSGVTPNAPSPRFEWKWRADESSPAVARQPELCLAMSGGGTRSAAFNIGVLKGMHHAGVLKKVDVASSVSGGGYALSWYLYQNFLDAPRDGEAAANFADELFNERGLYMRHLYEHSRVYTEFDYAATALSNLLLMPVNLLANGLFGLHANTGVGPRLYQAAIKRTFQTSPNSGVNNDPSIAQLRDKARQLKLPLFVFNTTAIVEDDASYHAAYLGNSVFEFAPYWFGSDAFGRWKYGDAVLDAGTQATLSPQLSLSEITAISGAAVDINGLIPGHAQKVLLSSFNQDLGVYIDNPRTSAAPMELVGIAPLPGYLFSNAYRKDSLGRRIYLTDGGYSDNLAVFSLVRRFCKNIVVVDAEEDPTFRFASYFRLKHHLRNELSVDLFVKRIEDGIETEDLSPQAQRAPRDSGTQKTKLAKEPQDLAKEPQFGQRWARFADRPVVEGTIRELPLTVPGGSWNGIVNVKYIKLAYDPPSQKEALSSGRSKFTSADAYPQCVGHYRLPPPLEEGNNSMPADPVQDYFCCIIDRRQ